MPVDTKTALLDSAERVARERGFDGFSYADLADDVGIRKASIHHHFPTKAALALALMRRYADRIAHACATISTSGLSGGDQLRELINVYRAALKDGHSLCLCVSFSISAEHLPEDVIAQMVAFRQNVTAWLEDVFANGQSDGSIIGVKDPKHEAAAALPLLEGAQLAARAEGTPETFDRALAALNSRIA